MKPVALLLWRAAHFTNTRPLVTAASRCKNRVQRIYRKAQVVPSITHTPPCVCVCVRLFDFVLFQSWPLNQRKMQTLQCLVYKRSSFLSPFCLVVQGMWSQRQACGRRMHPWTTQRAILHPVQSCFSATRRARSCVRMHAVPTRVLVKWAQVWFTSCKTLWAELVLWCTTTTSPIPAADPCRYETWLHAWRMMLKRHCIVYTENQLILAPLSKAHRTCKLWGCTP